MWQFWQGCFLFLLQLLTSLALANVFERAGNKEMEPAIARPSDETPLPYRCRMTLYLGWLASAKLLILLGVPHGNRTRAFTLKGCEKMNFSGRRRTQ
jgi:hypothetical protein